MYKHVVVGIAPDHRAGTETAKKVARLLAGRGKITLMTVVHDIPIVAEGYIDAGQIEQIRQEVAEALEKEAAEIGAEAEVVIGHAGRTLVDRAEELGADCIIVASHRPGLTDYLLGSTAGYVARHAKCSVHVVRKGED
ncbi:MAG: universal stress protein [Alphaproteobacteria bacterium]|nr:MAG: universal stress protein [Alphaproteobacteria bacterium]